MLPLKMLSVKKAEMAIRVLALLLVAALSFVVVAEKVPESGFIKESIESLEASSDTVLKLSAATLSTSLAISALPDDFATPLAETLADMNVYFIVILAVLFFEKVLIQYGIKLAFMVFIPAACVIGAVSHHKKLVVLKGFAVRLCVLGLAIAFVVPCSTHITNYVASDFTEYTEYINETIAETENSADKLNEVMYGGEDNKNIFEKLSDLFETAIRSVSDFMLHFRNTIRKCMNSIAILIMANCLMPLLTFFVLKWVLKETFQIVIPTPPLRRSRRGGSESEHKPVSVHETVGE